MNKILVTGGCGFIGSNFIHYWQKKHPEDYIFNLDALTYAGNPANLEGINLTNYQFIRGDITDEYCVEQIMKEVDTVVHFAAESHVYRSVFDTALFVKTNVTGTFILLEEARKANIKRFLHVSTDEVYGSLEPYDAPFTEETPYAPNNPYSASKGASDFLARSYFKTWGFPVLITHCCNNYGPRQYHEKLIPLVIHNALNGKPIEICGDGLNIRDWIHVEDHITALEAVLLRGIPGETYNIGANNEWKNVDIIRIICRRLNKLKPDNYTDWLTYIEDRPGNDRRYAIDPRKIMNTLDWIPRHKFYSSLDETIQWYLNKFISL